MRRPTIDRHVLADPSWWHWAATVPLLAAHLIGAPWAIEIAIALCSAVTGYFYARVGRVKPFPVQIRLAYLGLLSTGLLPWMNWLYWVPLVGTTAMVTVGYCPLARFLSLLPFNRDEPISWVLVKRAFLRDPLAGGLLVWPSNACAAPPACCSLQSRNLAAPPSASSCSLTTQRSHYAETH